MKNLKIKMLLLMSAILVLILSGMCYAGICIFNSHPNKTTVSTHEKDGLHTSEYCPDCYDTWNEKVDKSHVLQLKYHDKDATYHIERNECNSCNYVGIGSYAKHVWTASKEYSKDSTNHWQTATCVCERKLDKYKSESHDTKGANGACSVCGYRSVTPTANYCPGSSSGKHMWESGYTYEKIDAKQHNKNRICQMCGYKNNIEIENHTFEYEPVANNGHRETCKLCGKNLPSESHKYGITYSDKSEAWHDVKRTCSVCRYTYTTIEAHTYKNGNTCTAPGCGHVKNSQTSTPSDPKDAKSLFGKTYFAMCVGQLASCYDLTSCSTNSGVTWTIGDSSIATTIAGSGTTLLALKEGTTKLTGTKGKETATCTITVFANHLVPGSYGSNETTHWISGKCSRCGASVSKGNPEKHTFPAGTPFTSTSTGHYQRGTCSVCNKPGRSEEMPHTFLSEQMNYDENKHWYAGNCTVCGKYYSEFGKAAHEYSGSKCKYCEYDYDRIHNYPTEIKIFLTQKKMCFNSTFSCKSIIEIESTPKDAKIGNVTYASSNTSVFSTRGGYLKCHSKGTADLIVTTVNGVSDRCTITVTDDHEYKDGKCIYCEAPESDVTVVNPTTVKTICSETKCSELVEIPAVIEAGKITWASSNPSVLVVTSDGKATPTDKYCGQATVMAKVDGITVASAVVNVHVFEGDPLYRYDRSSHYHKAVCKECKKELRIFNTEEAHIYVSGSTQCKECGYDRGTQSNVPTEIRFKRTAALLCVEHCDLKAKIECAMVAVPEILPDVAAKDSLTWTSSDNSIFAIENGYVVAKQKGKAVLTAKTSNGLTATCDIEVVDHETAIDMELNYNGKYHWRYGICGNSLGDIYNTDEIEHDFVKGVCKCGKKGGGENNPSHFVDIKKNDWYEESVDYVTEKGLMNGVGNDLFSPNSSMTRAMVVTVLYRMSGSDFTGKANFSDVGENEYYAVPVAWASENGIVTGYPDGTFAPNAEVTREQLVVILYRYANYLDKDTGKENHSNLESFSDYLDISDYSKDALSWGLDEGIISGTSKTTLSPKGNASRAQVATMLMRFDDEK